MIPEVHATTRQAVLTTLLKQGERSASDLASYIGVSVQAMRRHLRSLEVDGLVEASLISGGPGRPSNLWQLTHQGQNCFGEGSERFALDLLGSIEATLPPEMIESLLSKQALEKASIYRNKIGLGQIKDRLEKLVELRSQEGYLAELKSAEDGLSWYLNEMTCSIRSIVEKYPSFCDQELQLIRYTFPDCNVKRIHWRLECGHSCGFQITPLNVCG